MDKALIAAVLWLVLGNNVAILSDSLIKMLDSFDAPFQFVLLRQVSAVLILLPFIKLRGESLAPKGLRWHAARAHIWLFGTALMVLSLTTLPLATANALFYAAPMLTVVIARMAFKERVTWHSTVTVGLGMLGVLIIVNPTEFNPFAVAALLVAGSLAVNNLLIKKLPREHGILQTLFLTNLLGLPVGIAMAIWEGAVFEWQRMLFATGSTLFIMIYAATCIYAYRAVDSAKVTSAEYTGLIGAVAIGMVFFAEQPGLNFYIGSAMIVAPLIWQSWALQKKPATS
ncbi:hypothetical protein BFR57_03750 [Idiomarina sp. MD25a]|uniref:DMT family transporter n=1 Tax=Idiomarina sp. MD25a TaxID=1889913 RepID=UPI0008F8B32C|nr:DMT family transporter [Idiomarina sp. MD25a]OIM99689.1 hypothetical protein BFR57_03750 [Idiomarina sp. MD25a]